MRPSVHDLNVFKTLINKCVARLFFLLWPPEGEEQLVHVDLSIGFVFADEPNQLCVISISDDAWTPCISYQPLPERWFDWNEFDTRVKGWMDLAEMGDMDMEYYEVSHIDTFKEIVSKQVKAIEFATIKGTEEPFGVKLIFEADYVLLTSTACGTTFETAHFNQHNNVAVFQKLGAITYRPLEF